MDEQEYQRLNRDRADARDKLEIDIYGPESLYFRRKVKRHITEGVHFGGFLPHEDLLLKLADADIGFLALADATFAYATPTKLFEYIELGIPVLGALPEGAARELIESYEIGLVVDPKDVDGLRASLEWLIDHPTELRRLAAKVMVARDDLRPEHQLAKWRDAISRVSDRAIDSPKQEH